MGCVHARSKKQCGLRFISRIAFGILLSRFDSIERLDFFAVQTQGQKRG